MLVMYDLTLSIQRIISWEWDEPSQMAGNLNLADEKKTPDKVSEWDNATDFKMWKVRLGRNGMWPGQLQLLKDIDANRRTKKPNGPNVYTLWIANRSYSPTLLSKKHLNLAQPCWIATIVCSPVVLDQENQACMKTIWTYTRPNYTIRTTVWVTSSENVVNSHIVTSSFFLFMNMESSSF